MRLPLFSTFAVAPSRAPGLRYGVALLSTVLALIPTLFFSDLAESRLVVFAVAVMVSAWYGGWKPGLVATSFALTVSAYYSLAGDQTPAELRRAVAHMALFFAVALLICWFNAALRAAQESLRRSESNFRSLVMNAPYGICRCSSMGMLQDANPALVNMFGYASAAELTGTPSGKPLLRRAAVVPDCGLFPCVQGIYQPRDRVFAKGWFVHRRAHLGAGHSERQRRQ